MVVFGAADVLVRRRRRRGPLGLGERGAVEVVLEDRLHVAVAARTCEERAQARLLDPFVPVLLREPQQAEARAEAPLGMSPVSQNHVAKCAGVRSDFLFGPAQNPRWGPLRVRAMRARHVLGHRRATAADVAADVARDALASMQDLDRRRGRPDPDALPDELLRSRVQVVVQLEVVIDIERHLFPHRHLEGGLGER